MKNKHLKFRPSVAALHNRLLKTSEIPLTNCSYILCKNASRRGAGISIIAGADIHIFVFTDCKNNRFQKKLIGQNTNI